MIQPRQRGPAAVEQQSSTTREIVTSIQAVSGATSETAQAMALVVATAEGAGAASREVQSGATNIGREADTLRAKVDQFLAVVRSDSGDRRRFERIACSGVAVTLSSAGLQPMRAVVKDLSRGGVALMARPLPIGTAVTVSLPEGGGEVQGQVARADGGLLGIAFREEPGVLARVDRVLESLAAVRTAA